MPRKGMSWLRLNNWDAALGRWARRLCASSSSFQLTCNRHLSTGTGTQSRATTGVSRKDGDSSKETAQDVDMYGYQIDTIMSGDGKTPLAVHVLGPEDGTPLAMVAGIFSSHTFYLGTKGIGLARYLASPKGGGFRCYMLDNRGHGHSEIEPPPKGTEWKFQDWVVNDIPALLHHATNGFTRKTFVMAHSAGTAATMCALSLPVPTRFLPKNKATAVPTDTCSSYLHGAVLLSLGLPAFRGFSRVQCLAAAKLCDWMGTFPARALGFGAEDEIGSVCAEWFHWNFKHQYSPSLDHLKRFDNSRAENKEKRMERVKAALESGKKLRASVDSKDDSLYSSLPFISIENPSSAPECSSHEFPITLSADDLLLYFEAQGFLTSAKPFDCVDLFPSRIDCPILYLSGKNDLMWAPPTLAAKMASLLVASPDRTFCMAGKDLPVVSWNNGSSSGNDPLQSEPPLKIDGKSPFSFNFNHPQVVTHPLARKEIWPLLSNWLIKRHS
eukprot:Nk52_evm4s227 gene=Nk52_evmTU4s227